MLNRMKGAALLVSAVTLWSCGGGSPAPAPPQSAASAPAVARTNTTVFFGGGYVFAFASGNASVEVGAMHVPKESNDRHAHPMVLAIGTGDWDPAESIAIQNMPQSKDNIAWQGWDLTGYDVAIKPGGVDPEETSLVVPPYSVPKDPCAVPSAADTNNWFYVPDITRLISNSKPVPGLRDAMMTRINLSRGTLAVNALAPGCFSFRDAAGQERKTQLTAHGRQGVTYRTSSPGSFVDVVLTDMKTGQSKGKIRFKPINGDLQLSINTRLKREIKPNDITAMKFFNMYYDLVVDARNQAMGASERLTPVWPGAGPTTPGGECPPVSVGYQ